MRLRLSAIIVSLLRRLGEEGSIIFCWALNAVNLCLAVGTSVSRLVILVLVAVSFVPYILHNRLRR
jgi:hypothetical protein